MPAAPAPCSLRSRLAALALSLSAVALPACVQPVANPNGIYAMTPRVLTPDERGQPVGYPDSQPLLSGQVFAVELDLQQPAYVYVIHRRGGLLEGLYPGLNAADSQLGPGTIRLPAGEAWMRAPSLERNSRLCILLAAEPLTSQQRQCPQSASARRPYGVQPLLLAPSRRDQFPAH